MRRLYNMLVLFGVDPKKTFRSFAEIPTYLKNRRLLKRQADHASADFPFGKPYPCFGDRSDESGSASSVYFLQDLIVAQRVHLNQPTRHIDVGSRIDGFVAHVASFRQIEVLDIRPLTAQIPNVAFRQADLMKDLPPELRECCDSVSCLHTIEHFGLGRYGDSINFDGYRLGLENLHRLLKRHGKFYFSTPIGPQRIEFDAHRVFSLTHLLELFRENYRIDRYSYIDDQGRLFQDVTLDDQIIKSNCGCTYGCGIFEMTKL